MQKFLNKKENSESSINHDSAARKTNQSASSRGIEEQKRQQNTNCITRDAQNVYDKKKQRYDKIQRMRGKTQESNFNFEEMKSEGDKKEN